MKLSEQTKVYYIDQGKNCAVALLLAASDKYDLKLTDEDAKLVVGFGGGMGCGSTCGLAAASIAVLGKMFCGKEDIRALCGKFTRELKQEFACESTDCAVVAPKYKDPETRCLPAVVFAADKLEDFISKVGK